MAYLSLRGPRAHPRLYLAAEPDWWGSEAALEALALALDTLHYRPTSVVVCLGSSDHHAAALGALANLGFTEQPAIQMKMFKRLDTDAPVSDPPPEGESA
jgi:RimJ/RimL family protein N-acetyltransferase